jgi:hypothetical protein
MHPHLRAISQVCEVYGTEEILHTDGNETYVSADDLVRETRLNPQLAHPLSLLEQWDGSLVIKQEVYLPLHPGDLPHLEKAQAVIESNPYQDYHTTIGDMGLGYRASDYRLFFHKGEVRIDVGRGSRAILRRLIDALRLQQAYPAIRHQE